jgi:hypothetical protein
MPRLLLDGDWFDSIAAHSIVDTEFEELVFAHAPVLYPMFRITRTRQLLENDYGSAKPQLTFVDNDYRDWWQVLLEVGKPPSDLYLRRQVEVIQKHRYDDAFATMMTTRNGDLNKEALQALLRREQPGVFVLLSHPPVVQVSMRKTAIGIAEIFRSQGSRQILRINGEHPTRAPERVTKCRRDQMVQNLLRVLDPDALGDWQSGVREIEIAGELILWTRNDGSSGKVWLTPTTPCALPAGTDVFVLARGPSGRLVLLSA